MAGSIMGLDHTVQNETKHFWVKIINSVKIFWLNILMN